MSHPRLSALLRRIPLGWPEESFILCGSACLAVAGLRDVGDLDVMVTPELFDEALGLGKAYWDRSHGFTPKPKSDRSLAGRAAEYRSGIAGATGMQMGELECFEHYDFFTTHPPETIGITWAVSLEHARPTVIDGRSFMVLHPRHVLAIKACAMRKVYDDDFQALAWLIRTSWRGDAKPPAIDPAPASEQEIPF